MRQLTDFPDADLRIFDRPAPPDAIRSAHLIGICGTGMGSLATLLNEAGVAVRGTDDAAYPPMSTRLAELGIDVVEGFDAANLAPPVDLVVVGNACTPTHPEAAAARERGLVQLSFPETLAHVFLQHRRSLVVAGTHGKTTTTGLLAHVLHDAGLDPGVLVGGIMVDGGTSARVGSGPHFVVEGDEYDAAYFDKKPKFLHYRPASAIVTSMEFDHADIYDGWDDYREAFEAFAATVGVHDGGQPGHTTGTLALWGDDPNVRALAPFATARVRFYGSGPDCDVTARDVRQGEGGQRFTLVVDGAEAGEVFLPMSGAHNRHNALAVATLALAEGLSPAQVAHGLGTFHGMKRRQEVRGEAGGVLVVDDFAHHPTAVRETIAAIAGRWPERRVVAVFEPRSNSSRRKVFEQPYADAFAGADLVMLSAPPLRHNDAADDFMDVDAVVRGIKATGTTATAFDEVDTLLPALVDAVRPGDVVLAMSNGSFGGLHARLLAALGDGA